MITYETREELLQEYADWVWGLCMDAGDTPGAWGRLRAHLLSGVISQSEWELCAALMGGVVYFRWGCPLSLTRHRHGL